jgi:hypothetical protein
VAVQLDPIKLTLKAPGNKRLKLKYDELPSNFAFNFNLRRHNEEAEKDRIDMQTLVEHSGNSAQNGVVVGMGAGLEGPVVRNVMPAGQGLQLLIFST